MAKILSTNTEPDSSSSPSSDESFSLISNEKLIAIYTAIIRSRMLEQRATQLFQQGKLDGDLHASAGREASAAAIGIDLQPQDTLAIAPHDWLPAFVKGMSVEGIFHALAPGGSPADDVAMAEPAHKNIVVPANKASALEIVHERAMEARIQKQEAIVVVFIAPGLDSQKPWHKTMALAASKKLPVVFVHYVDQPASMKRTNSQSRNPQAMVHGVPAIAVDALDPVAVYRVAYEAIIRARQGRGASLLECTLAPKGTGAGGKTEEKASADPLAGMEIYLRGKGIEPTPHNRITAESFSSDLDLATRFLDR
jgi:TPP-dependent pyruvate/acetoin dehydrogenase alpha subunit